MNRLGAYRWIAVIAGLSLAENGFVGPTYAERLLDPCSAWDRHFRAPSGGAYNSPRKIHHVSPILPDQVAESSWLGAAVLDSRGRVREVHRVRPVAGDPQVDRAMQRAIKQWRYEPYLVAGRPIEVCIAIFVQIDVRGGSH